MKDDIKTLVHELNALNAQGRTLEAFERFYDDNVVMQENDEAPRIGKIFNRVGETASSENVLKINKFDILGLAFGENLAMIETYSDISTKDGGRAVGSQVAVQRWKGGKIISEKFYYNVGK